MSTLSPRLLMVVTRDIPAQAESGRERTMCFIKRKLSEAGAIDTLRLHSALERRSAGRLLAVAGRALGGLLRGRPIPLQTLLFYSPAYAGELEQAVRDLQPDAVYFDGVRSGLYALALRRRYADLTLVCDFDDLMSRRIEVLAERRQPISMGYLKKLVPGWVQRHVLDGIVARAIQAYEHRALRSLENQIAKVCDSVVLVSSVDAGHLREQLPDVPVEVIPPYMDAQRPMQPLDAIRRFIFIGADSLLQNRLTIEYLVATWQRLRPGTELHIFGKQTGRYPDVGNVVFRGFIDDLADAYQPGSVLLAPSFVGGGVKTKVLEAFSYGVVPVGTETTFEGIDADCSRLTLSEQQIDSLVCAPHEWVALLGAAGAEAMRAVAHNHGAGRLGEHWQNIVWPDKAKTRVVNF
jgi:glycosyltransferase involved in cell wall biosynthesis